MNQITRNANMASTVAGMSYARKLAAEGKNAKQIWALVRAEGYRLKEADAVSVWERHQEHLKAFRKAMAS